MKGTALLEQIQTPGELKKLTTAELESLASELRRFILDKVSDTGGHLASNLGVVELTIALHYCFKTPVDKIVWDVGHQCYVHKILTGRKEQFESIRQYGGISGFPKSSESRHDAFDTGHSSTSISAALGLACARDIKHKNHHVVAVIGDGSLTGGLAYEALNNAGRSNTNLIVILNDNEMSISKNVGALSKHLNDIRTAPKYLEVKEDVSQILNKLPLGQNIGKIMELTKEKIKYLLISGILFEELGFRYFGPVDGHDIDGLIQVTKKIKKIKGPVLLHVFTKKGKGYGFAENDPGKYHGIAAFDLKTGISKKTKEQLFSDAFGRHLVALGELNPKIVAVTAAMSEGTGLKSFERRYPGRFFDVGIAEGHGAVFSGGLAKAGLIPVFAVYSSFLQRAYDQLIHDICIQNLHAVFAIDRAGAVPGDGQTHQGMYDIAFLRHIPNMTVMAPKNSMELAKMLELAISSPGPFAIRYPKEKETFLADLNCDKVEIGKSEILRQGKQVAILAVGTMAGTALEAANLLSQGGVHPYVVNLRFVKPLDTQLLDKLYRECDYIFTIEDHAVLGGAGSSILEYYAAKGMMAAVYNFGFPDEFIEQGTREQVFNHYGLNANAVADKIMRRLHSLNQFQKRAEV